MHGSIVIVAIFFREVFVFYSCAILHLDIFKTSATQFCIPKAAVFTLYDHNFIFTNGAMVTNSFSYLDAVVADGFLPSSAEADDWADKVAIKVAARMREDFLNISAFLYVRRFDLV